MVAVILVPHGVVAESLESLLKAAGWAPRRLPNFDCDGDLDRELKAALTTSRERERAPRMALIATVDLLEVTRTIRRARRRELGCLQLIGGLQLDRGGRRVRHGEKVVSLTPCEYRVFACLAGRPGHVVSRVSIQKRLAARSRSASKNMVDVYVLYLRRKLASLECSCSIRTTRGVGYALVEEQATPTYEQRA